MTLLRGHFAMVVLVRTVADAATVEAALQPLTARGHLAVDARCWPSPRARQPAVPDAYTLHVHGADRPGHRRRR